MADGNFSVAKSCVDILGGSEDHLEDLANHLFYTDDETIKTHIAIIEWPFDFVNKKQSDRAFTKLMPYVKDVRRKYASLRQKEREALMAFNNNPSKENEVKLRELNKEMQKMVANVSSATTLLAYSCGESTYQENEDINRRIDLALSGAIY